MDIEPWEIKWSDALSMSNPEIDREHREFIELVNELNEAIINRREKSSVESILKRLLEHTVAHFATEERLLAEKNYPKAKEHTKAHSELLISIRSILGGFHNSEFSKEWIEMGLTIKKLLIKHILYVDTQYIEYLKVK